ncbi:MAG: helix-turn-helix domain-containing protein [Oscillospiraceae bacterium]|nr:helix-turn-helix domain-containing protein [Oscillospiraceae bacterium]
MTFGDKLIELRKQSNMTQENLAEKLNVTRQTISNWELNQTKPDLDQLKSMSQFYMISIDELVDNEMKSIRVESSSENFSGGRETNKMLLKIKKLFINEDNSSNRKRKFKMYLITISIIVAFIIIFVATTGIWTRFNANISREKAMDIAVSHAGGGRANTPELDWKIWRWLWYVEVVYDGLMHEIYINPNTGEVVRYEIDR